MTSKPAFAHPFLKNFSKNWIGKLTFKNISGIISAVLLFFGWFFILPSNYCSYATVLAAYYHVPSDTFFLASNIAGILGLFSAGIISAITKRVDRLLLAISSILLLTNLLLLVLQPGAAFPYMVVAYFLLGMYVAASTFQFLILYFARKRFITIGVVLALITLYSLFFKSSSSGITARIIYQMNLSMNLVIFFLVIVINLKVVPRAAGIQISENRPLFHKAFTNLTIYTLILSITLGFISHERNISTSVSAISANLFRVAPYVLTILFMLISSNRQHFGIVTYIANTLLIISIAYADVFNQAASVATLITILINCSLAVNQYFIFDSFFELSEHSNIPSLHISVGLCALIFGISFGDRFADFVHLFGGDIVDRFLIILIAIATAFLPGLRIQLTNLSQTSIFRINPVVVDLPPKTATQTSREVYMIEKADPLVYSSPEGAESLTNREKEVLDLLLKGYPSEIITSTLFISSNTLKRHVQNIYNKLDVHTRAELFRLMQKKQE